MKTGDRLRIGGVRRLLIGLLGLSFFFPAAPVIAKQVEFDYDIFVVEDTLVFWLDVTPALTQRKMEDLLSGLDIHIKIDIRLERPRRFLPARTLVRERAALLISHPLTEDVYYLKTANPDVIKYKFESQLQLSDFLADSLVFKIAPVSDIGGGDRPRLRLNITCKSFTFKTMLGQPGRRDEDLLPADSSNTEFFEDIFSLFFNLIGFGEESYRVISPLFDPDNLPRDKR